MANLKRASNRIVVRAHMDGVAFYQRKKGQKEFKLLFTLPKPFGLKLAIAMKAHCETPGDEREDFDLMYVEPD